MAPISMSGSDPHCSTVLQYQSNLYSPHGIQHIQYVRCIQYTQYTQYRQNIQFIQYSNMQALPVVARVRG